jgi:hypothetical protein
LDGVAKCDFVSDSSQIFRVARVFPRLALRQNGERAWPLAKMLLGAKHGGRTPIVSRIIVHELCALSLTVQQRCFALPQELKKHRSKMFWIHCRIN